MKIKFTVGLLALTLAACNSEKVSKSTLTPSPTETPTEATPSSESPSATPSTESSPPANSNTASANDEKATPTPAPIDEPAPGSDKDKNEKMAEKSMRIDGTWHNECANSGNGLSTMSTYTYKDGTETVKTELFSGASCQDAYVTTVQKNTVVMGEEVNGLPHAYHLIRTLGRIEATPFTEAAIKSLQTDAAATSSGEWTVGQSRDISHTSDIGRVEHAIVKIEDDKLYLGTLDEHGTPKFGAGFDKLAQFE